MRMLILSALFYACESWTLTAEIERRIHALEMRCYRRLLNISYKDHVTHEEVRHRIQNAIGVHDDLLTMVKKRKLRWYGHISRSSGMAKTILQGTVKGARRWGRQKRWEDNIKEWTGMGFGDSLRAAEDGEGWKDIVAMSSLVPRWPPRLRDWDEMRWNIRKIKFITYIYIHFNPKVDEKSVRSAKIEAGKYLHAVFQLTAEQRHWRHDVAGVQSDCREPWLFGRHLTSCDVAWLNVIIEM